MDVDLRIRYSDDRLCEVVVCQPNNDTALYGILTRRADLGAEPHHGDAGSPPRLRGHPLARSASPLRRLNLCAEFCGTGFRDGLRRHPCFEFKKFAQFPQPKFSTGQSAQKSGVNWRLASRLVSCLYIFE